VSTVTTAACDACGELPNEASFSRIYTYATPRSGELALCDRCRLIPYLERIHGDVCHAHFEDRSATMADKLTCGACRAAGKARRDRIQAENTIDPEQPYGAHIALTCVHHPELTWTTKNIDYIGARSIFFASGRQGAVECSCPGSDLRVVK